MAPSSLEGALVFFADLDAVLFAVDIVESFRMNQINFIKGGKAYIFINPTTTNRI